MLPFLSRPKKQDGVMMIKRNPDMEDQKEPSSDEGMDGVEMAMEDFCNAKDKNDYKGMAMALKAAFDILDSMPHHEGPHE